MLAILQRHVNNLQLLERHNNPIFTQLEEVILIYDYVNLNYNF